MNSSGLIPRLVSLGGVIGSIFLGNIVEASTVRFATFNASLNRNTEGELIDDLSTSDDPQAQQVAEIIQRVNPDVILINEFDFDSNATAASLFQQNYLSIAQNNIVGTSPSDPVEYPYVYLAPSNTGIASDFDLDNNGMVGNTVGSLDYANDAFGFGFFPGQFGMLLLSKHPILTDEIRTFQNFLWVDMPGALLPNDPLDADGNGDVDNWYTPEELAVVRLSSKSHWDVPINVNGTIIHALVSHPTPPVFDGLEDKNGTRNHDEIRFWSDYVTPGESDYIYDDNGVFGGIIPGSNFVIMGDKNADSFDGDSTNNSANQLVDNPFINTSITPSSLGGVEQAINQGDANDSHLGDPAFDTSDFGDTGGGPGNLRVDYVLPSTTLNIVDANVFWPLESDPLFPLVSASDHRLVSVDIDFISVPEPTTTLALFGLGMTGLFKLKRRK